MEFEKKVNATNLLLAAGVLLVVGAFLSWASVGALGINVSVTGFRTGDGKITFLCGAFLGYLGFRRMQKQPIVKWMEITTWVTAALALVIGVMNYADIDSNLDASGISVGASVGIGLYLTILGGAAGLVAAFMAKKEGSAVSSSDQSPPPPPPPSPGL